MPIAVAEKMPPAAKTLAKAKAAADHVPKAGGKPRAKPEAGASDLCFVCEQRKVAKKRFCTAHNRAHQAMQSQCKTAEEKAAFATAMSDPRTARAELTEFMENNADIGKWAKKKPVDLTRFLKQYGKREAKGDHNEDEGMSSWQFERWSQDVKGMTPAGTAAWWKELLEDKNVRRDHQGRYPDGRPGALQLYIPNSKMSGYRKSEKFIESAAETGTDAMRDASSVDKRALQGLALSHSAGSSEFWQLSTDSTSAWTPADAPLPGPPRAKRRKGPLGADSDPSEGVPSAAAGPKDKMPLAVRKSGTSQRARPPPPS